MELFYGKFYRDKYPRLVTGFVLAGIRLRGWARILKHQIS